MKSTDPAPEKATDPKTAFDRFTESAKQIVRVTKEEIEREEQKWQRDRAKRKPSRQR
jgi:hypothetical protein